jgi:hypothetical protein
MSKSVSANWVHNREETTICYHRSLSFFLSRRISLNWGRTLPPSPRNCEIPGPTDLTPEIPLVSFPHLRKSENASRRELVEARRTNLRVLPMCQIASEPPTLLRRLCRQRTCLCQIASLTSFARNDKKGNCHCEETLSLSKGDEAISRETTRNCEIKESKSLKRQDSGGRRTSRKADSSSAHFSSVGSGRRRIKNAPCISLREKRGRPRLFSGKAGPF